jgi:hypothetical protein
VVTVLIGSADPQAYWRKLKQRLKEEGDQTVTDCHTFKLRRTDVHLSNWELLFCVSDLVLVAPDALGIGAASFCSEAEKDIA